MRRFLLCFFLLFLQYGFSQSQYGNLKGSIVDVNNNLIEGVVIYLFENETLISVSTSQKTGEYQIDSLEYGLYFIKASHIRHWESSLFIEINESDIEQDITLYSMPQTSAIDEGDCIRPLYPLRDVQLIFVAKNDTLYCYSYNNKIDSVINRYKSIKIAKNTWKTISDDGSYSISKYKKIKPSQLFIEKNSTYFHGDYECKQRGTIKSYDVDGNMTMKCTRFFYL